ncbi:GNAT family N-acetyltransferase [Streptomyces sp. CMB-StM0423]|uniref:GNAT family N-acetyltransferase n=1 Tax=Streptomyces sp. CMB-StM0423 TaxID=2059884 RepID=UPI000C702DD4|nr:GNAT family N-acetyltransferase [Streptomyces sp. CMB-StM0423]AUH44677.1 GNAT family N-acetyltransferase [Streptomyces sp. CMB-StM0423]
MTTHDEKPTLRPARPGDAAAVARLWESAWRDAHLGHVSDALVAMRTPESFAARAAARVPETAVAEVGGEIAGFVTAGGDEVEQLFVAAEHRGTGVAALLLAEGERRVAAAGHERVWLAVVTGNARARRFYARQGWMDEGPLDYQAEGEDGPVTVPCHRYAKPVTGGGIRGA